MSPLVCIPKTGGALRVCVDYRSLNIVTEPDIYPLPWIEEMVETISKSRYISTMDLAKGYYQVPLAPEDTEKTAFATSNGKFEHTRKPLGLKNAPAEFH